MKKKIDVVGNFAMNRDELQKKTQDYLVWIRKNIRF